MKTGLWIVVVIVALFMGFLFGYTISVHTGIKAPAQVAPAGGYEAPREGEGEAPGYGAPARAGAAPAKGGAPGY